jgi:DNA-binding transcriptional regulator YiaG
MKYKDDLSRSLYEIAEDMYSVGAIDEKKFKRITKDCLVKEPVKQVRAKREGGAMQMAAVM